MTDEPFMQLYYLDELMDFGLEMCARPGKITLDTAVFMFDEQFNVGNFKVTEVVFAYNPALKHHPTTPGAIVIHTAGTKEVMVSFLKALKHLKPAYTQVIYLLLIMTVLIHDSSTIIDIK